jgi:hypothetical protein
MTPISFSFLSPLRHPSSAGPKLNLLNKKKITGRRGKRKIKDASGSSKNIRKK